MRSALAFVLCLGAAAPLRAESLVVSLSTSRVAITSNYTGAAIVAFGAIEKDAQTVARASAYDIVVTVRGPRASLVVREKEPLGPIWLNRERQPFPDVPLYIAVLSSRRIEDITTEALRARLKVGLQAIVNSPDFTYSRGGADRPFREALLRLQRREGLYIESPRGVTFLTSSLFRVPVPIPAIAPPGNYEVDVVLFSDNVMLSRAQTNFELVKTGFEQQVAGIAREWSLLYGLAIAVLALTFGWIASVIFRRD
ncbi:MAG TPA: TIGR02186 family protein [Beijerinckiaceae bacterium]